MNNTAVIAKLIKSTQGTLYLYPGGTIAPLMHECVSHGVELVCARAEQGAGYMAIAEAQFTGKPAFTAVTSGPGATNIITCIADAYYDSVPLIVFTGQIGTVDLDRSSAIRQRGFQEIPITSVAEKITKKTFQPRDVKQLIEALSQAYHITQDGRPGPVLIDLPMNMQMETIAGDIYEKFSPTDQPPSIHQPHILPKDLTVLHKYLKTSKKPIILAGGGAQRNSQLVRNLAQRNKMPVITSLRGLGVMPTEHHLSVGWIGHTGFPWSNWSLYHSDLILVLGSRLDVRQTGTELSTFRGKTIIHVDIDKNELQNCRIPDTIAIHAPIDVFLRAACSVDEIIPDSRDIWLNSIQKQKTSMLLDDYGQGAGIKPNELLSLINSLTIDRKSAVVTGVGAHQQWAARYFSFDAPDKTFMTSAGHGTMGFALPVALALKKLETDRLVLCIDGDGSFQMNIQELFLTQEYNLPIKIIVMDNNRLGIVSQFQQIAFGGDPVTGNFRNPDFVKIAEAYGVKSWMLTDINVDIINKWLDYEGAALLHVKIQHDAQVSPMLLPNQRLDQMWYNKNA